MKTDRKIWLDKSKKLLVNYRVLIIQGLRRIGKSVLMEECSTFGMFEEYEKKRFQVGLFGQDDKEVALEMIKTFKQNKNTMYLLLVDEFQDLEDWDKFFRTVYDLENVKIIATGSVSANKDMVSNTEGGRFAYLHMKPLSFIEFKDIYTKYSIPKSMDDLFNTYATMGSYPDQEFNIDVNNLTIYKKQVSDNIIEKIKNVSMLKRAELDNEGIVMAVLLHMIEHNGSTLSVHGISKSLGYHQATIGKVLSYLKQTFLIYEIANSYQGMGRAAAANTKYYLNDHTFYLFVDSIKYADLKEPKKGALFENIIFNNIRSSFERHEATLHFEKDNITKADIDMVVRTGQEKHYFEIKNTTRLGTLSKNQKEFSKTNELSVIYLGETQVDEITGIQYINYLEFMKGSKKWILNK